MFKSVYTRYIVSFIMIFVLSFLCFGAIIYGYVFEYAENEMKDRVKSAAYSGKTTLDLLYQSYVESHRASGNLPDILDKDSYKVFYTEKESDILAVLDGMAKISDVCVLILDDQNRVAISTDQNLEGGLFQDGYEPIDGVSKEKVCIEGIMSKESYICTFPLSGMENDYRVFAYNLSNADKIMIGKLVQAMALSAVVVWLLGFAGCMLISNGMIRPLREMSKVVKRFALGDFSARVTVRGQDEIADLADSFNDMAQALSDLEEQRNTFLANISHDLRTPMTSISGFIDGILDGTIKPEDRDHYLNIIGTEVKRLSRLVCTLLEVTRIEAGARKFNMTDFDICEMAMMILFSFEKQIDDKKLLVEFNCTEERVAVSADADAIHQVLYNLIDNAVKFSYEKGILRVTVRKDDSKKILVEVYNEGNGISKEDLPHVFDRFYKADKSRGMDKTGVGLGLFIVKAIIQAHGDTIEAESEEGKYCLFRFLLPAGELPNAKKRGEDRLSAPEDKK